MNIKDELIKYSMWYDRATMPDYAQTDKDDIIQNVESYLQTEGNKLNRPAVISWVAASEKLPTVDDNGQKVLIYRIMNDSQTNLAISIHETNMVKYCNPNETWWMELPEPPCL